VTEVVDANVHLAAGPGGDGAAGWASDWPPVSTLTADRYAEAMRAAGIGRAVFVTTTRRDGFDNGSTVAAAAGDPARFAAVGNVDVLADGWTLAGLHGVRFYGGAHEDASAWLEDPRAEDAWARAGELGLVVSAQRTRARALEPLERLACRHPDVPVVVYSAGDPSYDEHGRSREVAALVALAARSNVHLLFAAETLRRDPPGLAPFLERVADAYGPERLLWGSFSQFAGARAGDDGASLAELVDAVRERFAFLGADGLAAVLGGTASWLYFERRKELP
jgi:predicted TIM-barrel fold metal-dependent hydrolase